MRGTLVSTAAGAHFVRYRCKNYTIRFRDANGKLTTESAGTSDRAVANARLAEAEVRIQSPAQRGRKALRDPVDRLIADYIAHLKLSQSTHFRSTESHLRRLRNYLHWNLLQDITLSALQRLRVAMTALHKHGGGSAELAALTTKPPTIRTIRAYLIAAKGFYSWVSDETGLPNILERLSAPSVTAPERRPRRPLTFEEIGRLIEAAKSDAAAKRRRCVNPRQVGRQSALVYELLACFGMRPSQLRRVLIRDIQLQPDKSGVITLTPKVAGQAKVARSFSGALGQKLFEWKHFRQETEGAGPFDPFFVWLKNQLALFHEHLEIAGIPKTLGGRVVDLYTLRGCYNTWLARLGVDEKTRMRNLGHSSPFHARQTYLLEQEDACASADALIAEQIQAQLRERGAALP